MVAKWVRAWLVGMALSVMALAGCGGSEEPVADWRKADVATFQGHGVWWTPGEPGTGFFFEAQGALGIATFYMYESNGRPVWYSALGSFADAGGGRYRFSGNLLRYSGGQTWRSTVPKTPTSTVVGPASIVFDGDRAEVALPGRSFVAEKFYKSGQGTPASSIQPETGIYWNPAESGRGFTMEVNGNYVTVAVFHYDPDGQPIWHLVGVEAREGLANSLFGDFRIFSGGQALTGPYKAPTSKLEGMLSVSFLESCKGKLAFPVTDFVPVQRFAFGSLPPGKECRTPPPGPQATTIFTDVTLKQETLPYSGLLLSKGETMPFKYGFGASGNIASLNGRTVYVIVEDPAGFYTSDTPRVTLRASPPGAVVALTPKPLAAGTYAGMMRFYACLDPACSTQFAGSPFLLPFKVFVQ